MKDSKSNIKVFNPKKSIKRASGTVTKNGGSVIITSCHRYEWSNSMERVELIRRGLPYESIEVLSSRADLSIKNLLTILSIPQTTYNKKKKDSDKLDGRDSEIILVLTEVLDFGIRVFDNEKEKFHRWLKKPNISLGGVTPESLFDSLTGIQEVKKALNRIEYGNFA